VAVAVALTVVTEHDLVVQVVADPTTTVVLLVLQVKAILAE
jgi:hypothetical protein